MEILEETKNTILEVTSVHPKGQIVRDYINLLEIENKALAEEGEAKCELNEKLNKVIDMMMVKHMPESCVSCKARKRCRNNVYGTKKCKSIMKRSWIENV